MKKINLKKYFSYKNAIFLSLLFVAIFLFGGLAFASEWVNNVVGGIIGVFISGVTKILILLVNVLIVVASYSDFIHADAVTKGWVVVRDVCNMFFVVILLVIAFATILGQEEYSAKKNLPKLIMAAVLINFSKLFCGLMIDVASVVMLTFVNAFKEIGSGNIIDMLGISDVLKYGQGATPPSLSSTVAAYIFGLIYVLIATVVVASMLAMLVMRIVMIWIYVVLSPAAFFLQAVPGKGQQYASQWWSKWSSNLIVGPVLAFFLWLSFAALQSGSPLPSVSNAQNQSEAGVYAAAGAPESIDSKAGSVDGFAKFVIAIGMLLGGMKIAQEVGGETGSVLGKGMTAINKGKAMAISGATSVAKGTGRLAGRGALGAVSLTDKWATGSKGGDRKSLVGKFAKGWGDDLQAAGKKKRKEAASGYLKKLGISDKGSAAGQDLIENKTFQNVSNATKGFALGALTLNPVGMVAGAVGGWAASSAKGGRKERITNYESGEKEFNQARTENDNAQQGVTNAQADLDKHDNSQYFADQFKLNADKVALLGAKPTMGIGSRTTAENDEYIMRSKFVKDQDNIAKNDESLKYLQTSDLSEKQQAVQDAQKVAQVASQNLQTKQQAMGDKTQYDKDVNKSKKFAFTDKLLDRFSNTKAAMGDNTKIKDAAKAKVKIQADEPDYWQDPTARRYSMSGLNKSDKEELSIMNAGGKDADVAISNLMGAIKTMPDNQAEQWAKALAALEYKDNVKLNPNTLGKVKEELKKKTSSNVKKSGQSYNFNADNWKDKVSLDYREFDKNKMVHKEGQGNLQFDAFAKNSAKSPVDRNSAKDIMGVSFAKYNDKAKQLGLKQLTKDAAGVNADSTGVGELSKVMSSLIDDEIKALQMVGSDISASEATKLGAASKIGQLSTAKARLDDGKLSGMSLKNSDIDYLGDNDSEKRRAEYNSTQHETMHNIGAKDEELVDEGAGALQGSKLIGQIPGSSGQRYDQEIGKLIAGMEQASASQDAIRQAIASQIEKWQVPNAQRVVETENGQRDSVKAALPETEEKTVAADVDSSKVAENFEKAIDKITVSLNKSFKPVDGKLSKEFKLSIVDKDFLRKLSAKSNKISSNVVEKLKPLGVMAAAEEKRRNP